MATTPGGPGLTPQQAEAVALRGVSVALSAGAGCGKTHVLTERFLAQLQPKTAEAEPALSRVVAITFTERAAREMRDRIRRACRQRLETAPEAEAGYWLRLWRQLDAARISTIHSFCSSLLRRHAVEAGLDPRFAQLDEAQARLLAREVVDDQLRRMLTEQNQHLMRLAESFELDTLTEHLLVGLTQTAGDLPNDWLTKTEDDWIEHWRERTVAEVLPAARAQLVGLPEWGQLFELVSGEPLHPKWQANQAAVLEAMTRIERESDFVPLLAGVAEQATVQSISRSMSKTDPERYVALRDSAKVVRETARELSEKLAWNENDARHSARLTRDFTQLLAPLDQRFAERKAELAVLDFQDLLRRSRDLLCDERHRELRARVSRQLDLVLVDEFQDTDPVQVELVQALCGTGLGRGKLFFVGDLKQSIYRFRGADPGVLRRLREAIPARGRLPLSQNFRSQPGILEFVNHLFADDLEQPYEPLQAHRQQVAPRPCVEFLWAVGAEHADEGDPEAQPPAPDESSGSVRVNQPELLRREARWIARRLAELLKRGEPLVWQPPNRPGGQPTARAVRPGDIALVFRRLTQVHYYEDALRQEGIDYYLVGGQAFYNQQEIFDLAHLLRALVNPADELALFGVLRSPLFALSDETLFWMARSGRGLRATLLTGPLPGELEHTERQKAERAAATLRELTELKDRQSVAQLLERALELTSYDAALIGEFLGTRKLANLRKLIDQAQAFDQSGLFTLGDYVVLLESMIAEQPREAPAATAAEKADVVRLMTIHQSKGLEFPVVVVPDCNQQFGNPRGLVVDRRWGPLLSAPASDHAPRHTGLVRYQMLEKQEDEAERLRQLYVATTRAADYLILSSAWKEHPGKLPQLWTRLLARRFDLETGAARFADGTTGPTLARVTQIEPEPGQRATAQTGIGLERALAAAREAASQERGRIPSSVAPVAAQAQAARRFSFSRLAADLELHPAAEAESGVFASGESLVQAGRQELVAAASLDPQALGTLVHAVLARCDFRPGAATGAARLVAVEAQRLDLTLDDAGRDEVAELIERFARSSRGQQLAQARRLERELEFLLAWPPGTREPNPLLFEGVIDVLYQDPHDGWHILDYKTNRLNQAGAIRLAESYRVQLWLYALAVEQILGTLPESLVLHFLVPGSEHCWTPDPAARDAAIAQIDARLADARGAPRQPR